MVPADLKKAFVKGDFSPVYYFYGENTFLIDKTVELIIASFFPSKEPGMGLEYFDGQTNDPSEIINSVRTLPFGAEKKLVIVKSAASFKADQAEKFGSYFSSPSKRSCLVFVSGKMVFKGKLLTALKKAGQVEKFENPKKGKDVQAFISQAFECRGRKLPRDALQYMVDNTGNDLSVINKEIEKIILFCGDKKSIAKTDMESVLTAGNRDMIYNLTDEVVKGDVQRAVSLLGTLIDGGFHPLAVLKAISNKFKRISIVNSCSGKNIPIGDMGRKIGVHNDFALKQLITQARGWSSCGLGKAFEEIFATDFRLKSSRINGKVIMEELVFRLVSFRGQS